MMLAWLALVVYVHYIGILPNEAFTRGFLLALFVEANVIYGYTKVVGSSSFVGFRLIWCPTPRKDSFDGGRHHSLCYHERVSRDGGPFIAAHSSRRGRDWVGLPTVVCDIFNAL